MKKINKILLTFALVLVLAMPMLAGCSLVDLFRGKTYEHDVDVSVSNFQYQLLSGDNLRSNISFSFNVKNKTIDRYSKNDIVIELISGDEAQEFEDGEYKINNERSIDRIYVEPDENLSFNFSIENKKFIALTDTIVLKLKARDVVFYQNEFSYDNSQYNRIYLDNYKSENFFIFNNNTADEYATWLNLDVYNLTDTDKSVELTYHCYYFEDESFQTPLLRQNNVYVSVATNNWWSNSTNYNSWSLPAHSKLSLGFRLNPGQAGILEKTKYVLIESDLLINPLVPSLVFQIA